MDQEDRLVSELDAEQANEIDSIIGKKIWNFEVLDDGKQCAIKIMFSEDEEQDYVLFHSSTGLEMYIVHEIPKQKH